MKRMLSMVAFVGLAGIANAQLLYPSTAGDFLLTPGSGNIDDTTYTPSGGAAFALSGFTLFGAPVTPSNFRVNANGFVHFSGATNPTGGNSVWVNRDMPFASSNNAMIAPLWDDLYFTGVGTAINSKSIRVQTPDVGTYVVTWQGAEVFQNTTPDLTFQVILLGNGNSLGAPAGSIIFCYDVLTPGTNNFSFTTGINRGDGSTAAGIPSIGLTIRGNTELAILSSSGHSFVPNASGGYDYVAGKIPAPGAVALLGLGGLLVGRRRR